MSDLAIHEAQCLELFGSPCSQLHVFLDQCYDPVESPYESVSHRIIFHHLEGINEVVNLYGANAFFPAVVHILEDCLGYLPYKKDYLDGTVDSFGRPTDQSFINTHWLEKMKVFLLPLSKLQSPSS